MKQAFISVPMRGKTPGEIQKRVNAAKEFLAEKGYIGICGYDDIINSKDNTPAGISRRIYALGYGITVMSKCSLVYMCSGWQWAPGCQVEYKVARMHGLVVMFEV